MFKKIIAIVLMAFFITSCAPTDYAQAATITLERAKSLARSHSRKLSQLKLSVEKAQYQLNQAQDQQSQAYQSLDQLSSYYNSLRAQLTSLEEQEAAGDTSVTGQIDSINTQLESTENQFSTQFSSVASSTTIREAEDTYDDTVAEQAAYKEQLDYAIEKLYASILTQEDSLVLLEEQLELKETMLVLEEKRLEMGNSSSSSCEQLRAEIEAAKQTIAENQVKVDQTKGELNDYMGRDYNYDFDVEPFALPESGDVAELDTLLKKAANKNLSIAQMEREIEQSEKDSYWVSDYYESQIQSIEYKNKKIQLEDEEAGLELTITNLLSDYEAKKASVQIAATDLNISSTSYDREKKRFQLGQISKIALQETQLSYQQAQNKMTAAGYSLYLAERALELAAKGIF